MKIRALFVFLLAASLALATERARFNAAPSSGVTITGTSTLHEWTMQGSAINGRLDIAPEIVANPINPESWKSGTPAMVSVKIPVAQIKSEHARMNNIMLEAMKANSFSEISYELLEASPAKGNPDSFVMTTRGKLTIAGVTHDLLMDVAAKRDSDKRYVLTGEAPLKMTDFGIKPPVTMLGTLKTGDEVKVSFRWIVDRTE